MKRIIAAVLAASMLLLCACNGGKTDDATASVQQTAATLPITQVPENFTEGWNSSLLPQPFAAEPEGCKTISTKIVENSAFKSPYTCDAVRIELRCLPEQMEAFSQEMVSLGYIGGICFYENNEIYDDDVVGHWTNDEYFATVSESKKSTSEKDGLEYTLTLDVAKCENSVPEVLTMAFPSLEGGWTRAKGKYTGVNSVGVESTEADETLSDIHWVWNFKDRDAFFGVTQTEYEKFLYGLTKRGFDGYTETENDGIGTVEYYSAEYEYGGNTFGVYLCYISYLSTLEMIFSNDITYYYSEDAS